MKILFVCLGNICRSPLAEAVFTDLVAREGLAGLVLVDSAGTSHQHAGERADPRSRACALRHGLEIPHRARGLVPEDFDRFDLLIAMDEANASDLRRQAPTTSARRKVRMFREWDPSGPGEIRDPYYGTDADFERVWHVCDRSSPRLMQEIKTKERL